MRVRQVREMLRLVDKIQLSSNHINLGTFLWRLNKVSVSGELLESNQALHNLSSGLRIDRYMHVCHSNDSHMTFKLHEKQTEVFFLSGKMLLGHEQTC